MAFEFHLPDLAEGMVEAEIVSWKVGVGDRVELDQPIVEVMSDKATVEIPSPKAGVIAAINYKEGDIAEVGAVLFIIDDGTGATALPPSSGNGATQQTAAHQPAATEQAVSVQLAAKLPEVVDVSATRTRVQATPATRRLARQLQVELSRVRGSGKRGRITSDDVRNFSKAGSTQVISVDSVVPLPPNIGSVTRPLVSVLNEGAEERIPFRGMRKRIADNMTRSKFTATHFTYVEDVDVTELVALRKQAKERAASRGLKLTYLPFIIKAVVAGLKKWPSLNASLDESKQEIVRKLYYNIGIAAQSDSGLMVSVIRHADQRSIFDLAGEIGRLGADVESGKIRREDLVGSTFTISSLGKLGGLLATPIINFPEVGIIGVHKIEQRAVVRDGEIVPRWMTNLSISLDHRLVDGWDGAMFLQEVKSLLEDPTLMFMELV